MEKIRNMMDPAFCWDLSPIYKDREAWETALAEATQMIPAIIELQGTLAESKEALKKALDIIFDVSERTERIYLYAMLFASQDNGDPGAQDMEGRADRLYVDFATAAAFLEPEILSIPSEKLTEWLDWEGLELYRHRCEDIARMREHTLSKSEEMMLAMLGDASQTPKKAFDMFESVDMRFEPLSDGSPLTHAYFGKYRESADAAVRKEAFEKYFGEYKKYINTVSILYSGSVKQDCYFANVRHYGSAVESAMAVHNIPVELYGNLIKCIHEAVPVMERYLNTRSKLLGTEHLKLYDLYVPLVDAEETQMSYDRAKQLVLDATKPLGEEYQKLLNRAFSERWIDVYENAGKTTGAYSCGVHGVHPYVLLNFAGKYDDAFTLAHELGHSMHSWFSSEAQAYVNHDYAIFVAEVASTVNEVLLTKYLLSVEEDSKKRAYILNHLLEGFRTTVFRQTLFAEFELKAHEMYEKGMPLTPQALNQVYHDLNKLYYPNAEGSEYTDVEWARIPHFYNAFYVYQYATGFCSAIAIADRILNEGGVQDYIRFLSTGGSMYPIDELKIAGVDLTTTAPIERAMKVFADTVEEFESIMLR